MKTIILMVICLEFTIPLYSQNQTVMYQYDLLNRLTRVDYGSGNTITYINDEVGNRVTQVINSNAPPTPIVATTTACGLTASSEQLNGTINPSGLAGTFFFVYGSTIAYGETTAVGNFAASTNSLPVSVTVSNLSVNTTYHYALVAKNVNGTTPQENDIVFTTAASNGNPNISYLPVNLSFSSVEGGANPPAQSLTISNNGGGILSWTVISDQPWLHVTPLAGLNTQSLSVSVDATNLTIGSYTGHISISSAGSSNSPQQVPVSFQILPSGNFSLAWQYKNALPNVADLATGVVYNNMLHIFIGLSHYTYDPAQDQWTILPNLPGNGVSQGASTTLDTKIYIVGGTFNQFSIFDVVTSTWSIGTSPQIARLGPAFASVNGKLYLIGGLDANANGLNTVEMYDPTTKIWTPKSPIPTSRGFASVTVVNGLIYVIGGQANGIVNNIVEVYDPNADTWTSKNPMPTPRARTATSILNNKIYVMGGSDLHSNYFSTVEEYDPIADAWRTATPIQTARMDAIAGNILGKIYVGGGAANSGALLSIEGGTPTAQSPIISTNPSSLSFSQFQGGGIPPVQTLTVSNYGGGILTWSSTNNQPWLSVTPPSGTNTSVLTISVNTSGLSVGNYSDTITISSVGATNNPLKVPVSLNIVPPGSIDFSWQYRLNMPTAQSSCVSVSYNNQIYVMGNGGVFYRYDPSSNNWSSLTSSPFLLSDGAATVINGKIYGMSSSDGSQFAIYDLSAGSWSTLSTSFTPRSNPLCFAVNGKIYLIGGTDNTNNVLNSVQMYDPGTNTWSSRSPIPNGRVVAVGGVVNNIIYVIGGRASTGYTTGIAVYDPSTDTWTTKTNFNTPSISFATSVVLGNKIYVLGGGTHPTNKVFEYNPVVDTSQFSYPWRTLTPMQTPRSSAVAAMINNSIYIVGGVDQNGSDLSSVEQGSPATHTISGQITLSGPGSYDSVSVLLTGGYPGSINLVTNVDHGGDYSFGGLVYGSYVVTPFKTGYSFSPPYLPDTISGANRTNQNFTTTTVGSNIWSRVATNSFNTFGGVAFLNQRLGWISGLQGSIFHTTDGGNSWLLQTQSFITDYLNLIQFVDSLHGWTASVNGQIYATRDGGNSWVHQVQIPNVNYMAAITCIDTSRAWVAGSASLYRTINGGQSWVPLNNPAAPLNIGSIFFIDQLNGWVGIEQPAYIYRTTDGGNTWNQTFLRNNHSIFGIAFADRNNGWAIGDLDTNKILHSTDGGQTWIGQSLPALITGLNNIIAADSSLAWVLGTDLSSNPILFRTTNAGTTWIVDTLGTTNQMIQLSYAENVTWAVGSSGTVLRNKLLLPRPPISKTCTFDSLTSSSSLLKAFVNPNNLTTMVKFQFSTDSTFQTFSLTDSVPIIATGLNQKIGIKVDGLNPATNYYYRAVARNSAGIKIGSALCFQTLFAGPSVPSLVFPLNQAINQTTQLTLSWNHIGTAFRYTVQVATDSLFSSLIVNDSSALDTSEQIINLTRNSTYFWRVSAKNNSGSSAWSNIRQFSTIPNPPTAISTNYPPDSSSNQPNTLLLRWGSSTSAIFYHLEVSTDSNYSTLVVNDTSITDTFSIVYSLKSIQTYYWKVQAVNTGGQGAFSPSAHFTTTNDILSMMTFVNQWNLISIPLIANDTRVSTLFESARSSAFAYNPGSGYVICDSINHGTGYWIRFDSTQQVSLVGVPIKNDSIDLLTGWNLIGTTADTLLISGLTTNPAGVRLSNFFDYNGGYEVNPLLVPSHGYWVKADTVCQLILSPTLSSYKINKNLVQDTIVEDCSELYFTNGKGHKQTLRFAELNQWNADRSRYELPPRPPAGGYDVRFNNQCSFGTYVQGKCTVLQIVISTIDLPLRIDWRLSKILQRAYLKIGNQEYSLTPRGTLELNSLDQTISLIVSGEPTIPREYLLQQNYPNPFNPTTTINYQLPIDSKIMLRVYDILGQIVATIADNVEVAGYKSVNWNASSFASGIYFYRLEAASVADPSKTFTQVKKMILIK